MRLPRRSVFVLALALPLAAAPPAGAAFDPPECDSAPFLDVGTGHPYCEWIQQFEIDGITTSAGCGGGNYCPDAPVTRAQLAMHLERAMRGTDTWDPWPYKRTLFVHPVLTNGDPPVVNQTASGAHLMAVLNSIPDDGDPYLVMIEPGTYDIGSATFTQATPLLAIQGAPRPLTLIVSSVTAGSVFTVPEFKSLRVRDLHLVVSGSGASDLVAFHGTGGTVTLDDVAVAASGGGDTYALRVDLGHAEVSESILSAGSDGDLAAGVFVNGNASFVRLRRSRAEAFQGSETRAVLVDDGDAELLDTSFGVGAGTSNNRGLAVESGGFAFVLGGEGSASGTSAVGLYTEDGRLTVDGGNFHGDTATGQCVRIAETTELTVRRATLVGPTNLIGSLNCTTRVSFSHLFGLVLGNGGTIECRGVTTEAPFTFLPATCP